ncbi:MAG: KEOPS complex kinase/ATPase Bud32 [Nanoarchaeota archaeon]|nr:KEOPS complex kinase/ATPase Bud32 [Nanoarchaeota archaeon]
MNKLIQQGAEAKIFLSDEIITKDRIPKSYRHPDLDKRIRTRRTKAESKILIKAFELKINVPKVITTEKFSLQIEFIDGDKLSETLNSYDKKKQFQAMKKLGKQTALLHENNIIHGDLTTSNTILKDDKIFIIDFGLGFISTKLEDKAVDLHLIKQALEAKHFRSPDHPLGQNHEDLFKNFIKGYKNKESKKVLERLEIVERRGRYKH